MEYAQLKNFVINLQQEVKRAKQNPLNPDNIRLEKIKDIKSERERYKDLYVSESIKNKEYVNPQAHFEMHHNETRNLHSSATSKRPMTTISNGSTMRGGGFFLTQMNGSNASRPMSRAINGGAMASRRNIVIRQ